MNKFRSCFFALLSLFVGFVWGAPDPEAVESVSIYSHRHYEVDERLYEMFTEETGIEVNFVNAGADELIERLKAEGDRTPADLLITVDAGRLHRATKEGLLQPVVSEVLRSRIPAHLREPAGYWFGLTKRARVVVASRDRVAEGEIENYDDLTDPKWDNRIAIRSSSNIYNQSLMASMVAQNGPDRAREWATGIVENFARDPKGNDRDQMRAVAAGIADVAVVNTYYIGLMKTSENPDERAVVEQLRVFMPNAETSGTHINISGAGVTAHAPNLANAVRLLEFLVSDRAQAEYAAANFEYPVVEDVSPSELVADFGSLNESTLPLVRLGEFNREAVVIMDEVGWK